jgi:hypothetical protein
MSGFLIYCMMTRIRSWPQNWCAFTYLRNITALRSSVSLPTSLGSFPYNIYYPARLCSPCQSRQDNLDDYMRFVSSSSPSPSDEDKLSHSLLEGHFPPLHDPSHLPPYASAAQSARQRTSAYVQTSSSRTRPTCQGLVSSSQTNWIERRIGSCA